MRYLQPLLFQDTAADFVPLSVPSQQPALLKNINSFNNNHRLVCVLLSYFKIRGNDVTVCF